MTSWNALLQSLAESIDISPSKFKEAVERYRAVGSWLEDSASAVHRFSPAIYPQGSFALGTVVRPVLEGKEAAYDIDLVCELKAHPEQWEPGAIKSVVGNRLKEHATYRRMLDEEGRRCWTLNYAEEDGIGFHLDALPSVGAHAGEAASLTRLGVPLSLAGTTISITEKNKRTGAYSWLRGGSNPRGYAQWFASRMAVAFSQIALAQKRSILERYPRVFLRVEDVPDALVRTPLQRAVQILKRQRDVRFAKHELEAEKPISMIITTVAARAYREEPTVEAALLGIVSQIEGYVDSEVIRKRDGLWVIANPVNPAENFADRWNEPGSRRAEAFFEWVQWVRQDLALLEEAGTKERAEAILQDALGVVSAAPQRSSEASISVSTSGVPALGDARHCQPPPWPLVSACKVEVSGTVRASKSATKALWELTSRAVPKGKWIRFHAKTNTIPPYEVKWQVVNTGAEAAAAGAEQLRGGFDEGEAALGSVRWETAAYRGTHWIEAFVVKNGACVARSGKCRVRV